MSKSRYMSERQDKTPEQISDEDYKVAPTSADKKLLKKEQATGENHPLSQ